MNKLTRYGLVMGAGIALLGMGGITAAFATGTVAEVAQNRISVMAQVQNENNDNGAQNGETVRNREEYRFLEREEMKIVVAEALGMTVAELDAAHDAGLTLAEIAEQQGVSLDEVEAAIYAAKVAAIDEAVAAGEITADQADAIIARLDLAQIARDIFDRDEMQAIVADVLGVTVEELEAARANGTARELFQNADHDAIRAALEAYRAEKVQEALDAGLITQEQADQLLAGPFRFGVRGPGMGPGGHRPGGHGDGAGPMNGDGANNAQQSGYGDGTCDGTCDGTMDGPGPNAGGNGTGQGNQNGNGQDA